MFRALGMAEIEPMDSVSQSCSSGRTVLEHVNHKALASGSNPADR